MLRGWRILFTGPPGTKTIWILVMFLTKNIKCLEKTIILGSKGELDETYIKPNLTSGQVTFP